MKLTPQDMVELASLEEGMWIAESRYDEAFQAQRFADDFFEFGRSGRAYGRAQAVLPHSSREEIHAQLPLEKLRFRMLDEHTVQIAYNSHVTHDGVVEHARRSSLWTKAHGVWRMRFHQGTPYEPEST